MLGKIRSAAGMFIFQFLFISLLQAQDKRACDLVDVASVNSVMGTSLVYDATSVTNKTGKFECRYTDPATPGKYIAIGLLSSKISYGYDMLTTDFTTSKNDIGAGRKAGGKYIKFTAYTNGGANAFYMSAPKDNYTGEAFSFKFRKGDYIVTFSTSEIPASMAAEKVDAIFKLLSSKL